jgi:Arc/MetJ-type ribon-helix-helix transcriptional regulator
MKKQQDRIHIYYPVKDQKILEQAVELSGYDSASALIRELVRRYHRSRLRRAIRDNDC